MPLQGEELEEEEKNTKLESALIQSKKKVVNIFFKRIQIVFRRKAFVWKRVPQG